MHGDLETIGGDDVNIGEFNQETLFVSLGSYCAPASLVRTCGYRKAAFPFDWNILLDGEKLIQILNERFLHFLDTEYLVPFNWATLLNTRYHVEFVHDGTWEEQNASVYMPILQSKYQRRIERFKNLKMHQGKVFFLRSAYFHSIVDKNRFYKIQENIEISEEYAVRLHDVLRDFFPTLDFCLVIINNHEQESVAIEKKISDSLMMIRAAPRFEKPVMEAAYASFFKELLQESTQDCVQAPAITFSHRTDVYHTHQPVLYEMAMQTSGPIIEFGCGHGSTELLHEICKVNKRLLISLDDNLEWLNTFKEKYKSDSAWHKFIFVPGKPSQDSPSAEHWVEFMQSCDLLQECNFDICFIDQSPWQGRVETLKFMKDKAKFFIVHDCDYFPREGLFGKTIIPIVGNSPGVFDFSDVFRNFKVYFPIYPGPVWFGPPTLVGTDFEEVLPEIDFNDY